MLVILMTTMLVALALDVEGGRMLKSNDQVDHPQNFVGGIAGGVYPGPTFATGFGFGPSGFYTFPGSGTGSTTTPTPITTTPILPTPTIPGTPVGGGSKP
ncbi:hypothetical protein FEM48_Zijuj02G0124500 [Ziziphus jujuba var. spinosa]|uniref:Uncharacterized protein n=1 Tax=Ziziphus jujuba var. spinosa TaxID=714518 RepID=A0A978VVQ8_ZIZJJ|nr:hypothetical protein FEM48_Zijuj02G0124500 [Ziziphus jujuba var. spinosa]